jgi:hypothetical protein
VLPLHAADYAPLRQLQEALARFPLTAAITGAQSCGFVAASCHRSRCGCLRSSMTAAHVFICTYKFIMPGQGSSALGVLQLLQ